MSNSSYRILAAGMLVTSLGRGLYIPTSIVYFSTQLQFTVAEIGLALSCAGVAAFVVSVPMGSLMDASRRPRNIAIVYALLHGTAMLSLLLADSNPLFTLVVAALGITERGSSIARQTLVAILFESRDRVSIQARLRTIANAGISVGALVAAFVLTVPAADTQRDLIAGNALALLVLSALMFLLPAKPAAGITADRPRASTALRDAPFLTLTLLNGLLSIHSAILRVGLPLWITLNTDAPVSLVAVLYGVNTVLTVLIQVKVATWAQTVPAAARTLRVSGALTALACLTLLTTHFLSDTAVVVMLFVTTVLLTLGEVTQSAGGWGLAYGLARSRAEGAYMGAFSLGVSVQDFVGPFVVTACLLGMPTAGGIIIAVALIGVASGIPRTVRSIGPRPTAPRQTPSLHS